MGWPSGDCVVALPILSGVRQPAHFFCLPGSHEHKFRSTETGNDSWAFVPLAQTEGQLQARQGSPDDAIFWLNIALGIHQAAPRTREFLKETAVDLYYLGYAYNRLERYDEALKALQQAAEIAQRLHSPELWRVLNGIGFVRENQGRLQDALRLYLQATEILEKVSLQQQLEEVQIS